MDYYVSKKAGSILIRKPSKLHLVAGDHIPAAHWEALPGETRAQMIAEETVEGFEDPDSVKLSEAPVKQQIPIGVGKDAFMPEATVQPGQRRDAALDELIAKQRSALVDADEGGSPDGIVQVELPPEDEDEDEEFEDLTPEEQAAIRRIEEEA